jgi:hypothetical protein
MPLLRPFAVFSVRPEKRNALPTCSSAANCEKAGTLLFFSLDGSRTAANHEAERRVERGRAMLSRWIVCGGVV